MLKCCPYQLWKQTLENQLVSQTLQNKLPLPSLLFPDFSFVLSSWWVSRPGLAVLYKVPPISSNPCVNSLKQHIVCVYFLHEQTLRKHEHKINLRMAIWSRLSICLSNLFLIKISSPEVEGKKWQEQDLPVAVATCRALPAGWGLEASWAAISILVVYSP